MRGVVHRDLKPENILLGIGEESQKIYLVDFGISKIFRDPNGRHMYIIKNKKDHFETINHLLELQDMHQLQLIEAMN